MKLELKIQVTVVDTKKLIEVVNEIKKEYEKELNCTCTLDVTVVQTQTK